MAPFYEWGLTVSRLQGHFEEAAYFLPPSFHKFLVLISCYQPWKDERLNQPWNHPVVLNMGPLNLKSSIYYLAKFHCLVAFTLWDIGQYVYCNCLLTRLWYHKFWNWLYLSNQAVLLHGQKSTQKFKYLGSKESF